MSLARVNHYLLLGCLLLFIQLALVNGSLHGSRLPAQGAARRGLREAKDTPTWHPSKFRNKSDEAEEAPASVGQDGVQDKADAAVPTRPGFVKSALPECALHVFRHISKAAGTTMRFTFDKQVVMGEWEFLPNCHYGFSKREFDDTVKRFEEAAEAWGDGQRAQGPRIIIEIRNDWSATNFIPDIVPEIARLKEKYSAYGCQVTSSFLMREPLGQYISFYRYYIDKMQKATPSITPAPRGWQAWGRNITEWAAHIKDIQTREVMGNRCTSQVRGEPYKIAKDSATDEIVREGPRPLANQCAMDEVGWETFEKVARSFDVVGTTSNFNAFWLRLSDLVGFQHLEYSASNKAKSDGKWKVPNLPEEVTNTLKAVTRYDQKGYELISELEQDQIQAAGDDFERRLQMYNDASIKDGNKAYTGGVPPKSLYKWVKASDNPPEDWLVTPSFYTGPAKCKGFGSPHVVLVPHEKDIRCDRGCTFD